MGTAASHRLDFGTSSSGCSKILCVHGTPFKQLFVCIDRFSLNYVNICSRGNFLCVLRTENGVGYVHRQFHGTVKNTNYELKYFVFLF